MGTTHTPSLRKKYRPENFHPMNHPEIHAPAGFDPFDPANIRLSVPPDIRRKPADRKPYIPGPIPVPWFKACPPRAALTGLLLWYLRGLNKSQPTGLLVLKVHRDLFGLSQQKLHRDLQSLQAAGLISLTTAPGQPPVVDVVEVVPVPPAIIDGMTCPAIPIVPPKFILGPLPVDWFAKAGPQLTITGLALWRAWLMNPKAKWLRIRPGLRHVFDQDRQKQRRDIDALAALGIINAGHGIVVLPKRGGRSKSLPRFLKKPLSSTTAT